MVGRVKLGHAYDCLGRNWGAFEFYAAVCVGWGAEGDVCNGWDGWGE